MRKYKSNRLAIALAVTAMTSAFPITAIAEKKVYTDGSGVPIAQQETESPNAPESSYSAEATETVKESNADEGAEFEGIESATEGNDATATEESAEKKAQIEELIKQRTEEAENKKNTATSKAQYKATAVFGGDLTEEEKASVISLFGIDDINSINQDTLTHAEEVEKLSSILGAEHLGTKCLSSVLIKPLTEGSGISVGTVNIDYISNEMIYQVLATAGARDIEVKIVAPSRVSGTASLLGVLKAYSNMTGQELDADIINLTMEEISLLARLGQKYGVDEITKYFNKAREKAFETGNTNVTSLKEILKALAMIHKLEIEDIDINELSNMISRLTDMNNKRIESNIDDSKYIEPKNFKEQLDVDGDICYTSAINWLFSTSLESGTDKYTLNELYEEAIKEQLNTTKSEAEEELDKLVESAKETK